MKEKISNALSQLENIGIDATVDTFPNKVFKDEEKSKIKIVKKLDSDYKLESDWKTFNKEMKILECEVHIIRIYLRRQFTSPDEFIDQKNKVLAEFEEVITTLDAIE